MDDDIEELVRGFRFYLRILPEQTVQWSQSQVACTCHALDIAFIKLLNTWCNHFGAELRKRGCLHLRDTRSLFCWHIDSMMNLAVVDFLFMGAWTALAGGLYGLRFNGRTKIRV